MLLSSNPAAARAQAATLYALAQAAILHTQAAAQRAQAGPVPVYFCMPELHELERLEL